MIQCKHLETVIKDNVVIESGNELAVRLPQATFLDAVLNQLNVARRNVTLDDRSVIIAANTDIYLVHHMTRYFFVTLGFHILNISIILYSPVSYQKALRQFLNIHAITFDKQTILCEFLFIN